LMAMGAIPDRTPATGATGPGETSLNHRAETGSSLPEHRGRRADEAARFALPDREPRGWTARPGWSRAPDGSGPRVPARGPDAGGGGPGAPRLADGTEPARPPRVWGGG